MLNIIWQMKISATNSSFKKEKDHNEWGGKPRNHHGKLKSNIYYTKISRIFSKG